MFAETSHNSLKSDIDCSFRVYCTVMFSVIYEGYNLDISPCVNVVQLSRQILNRSTVKLEAFLERCLKATTLIRKFLLIFITNDETPKIHQLLF